MVGWLAGYDDDELPLFLSLSVSLQISLPPSKDSNELARWVHIFSSWVTTFPCRAMHINESMCPKFKMQGTILPWDIRLNTILSMVGTSLYMLSDD